MDIRGAEGRNGNKCPRGLNPQRLSPLKDFFLFFSAFVSQKRLANLFSIIRAAPPNPNASFFSVSKYMNGAAEKFSHPLGANPS